ncbi:MAG: hypothetical protein PHP00_14645 [Thiotrichaceae bacterium]|nr:hypothetical protein [Thiotrichaceae bacterium]
MAQLTHWRRKSLPLWVAGKLALASPMSSANGGFGKLDEQAIPELSLYQTAVSGNFLSTPTQGKNDSGRIFVKEIQADSRIDFMVSGIRNDRAMDIYLAFSTRPGKAESWEKSRVGHIVLDPQTLEIIAGIRSFPTQLFFNQTTSLGKAQVRTHTVTFSIRLGDLNAPQLQSDELYFQAFAVPAQTTDFVESQVSELDHYFLVREE